MHRKSLQYTIPATALLLAAAALRLWFVLHHAVVQNDSNLYAEIAQNWLDFHTYGFSTATLPRPTLIRLPGYPLFLILSSALFGHRFQADSFTYALSVELLLDVASCYLLARTAANLVLRNHGRALSQRIFLLTLTAAALCPFTANYVATPLSETPTLFTIALAFYALERWANLFQTTGERFNRYLYLLSAAMGASLLLRPDQALLVAAILPAMLWTKSNTPSRHSMPLKPPVILANALESRMGRRLRAIPRRLPQASRSLLAPALVALLLTLLPLLPWTIRNFRTFHQFQPLAPRYATDPGEPINKGFQRWYRTWAADFASTEEFYWKYPDEALDVSNLPNRAFDSDAEYDTTAQLIDDYNDSLHYHAAIDARFNQLATQRIHADPLRYYVELPVARLLNMLFHPRTEMLPYDLRWWAYRAHPAQTMVSIGFALLNIAFFIAGAFGALRGWQHARQITCVGLAYITLRCLLLLTLDNAEQRYTIELYPVLLLWIGLLLIPRTTSRKTQTA